MNPSETATFSFCGFGSNCNNWGPTSNGIIGQSYTCWNPQEQVSVACESNTWQCVTNLVTGRGFCGVGGVTASLFREYFFICSHSKDCNNWGSSGPNSPGLLSYASTSFSGVYCWNPKTNFPSAQCTSSQWQCAVSYFKY